MKKTFFGFGVFFVLLVFYGFHAFEEKEKEVVNYNLLKIEIKGAVLFPGFYEVSQETTLKELIYYAGGLTLDANEEEINYDLILSNNKSYNISFIEKQTETQNVLININTATIEELITLPGIGQTKAQLIIEYRTNNGLFKTIKDLMLVPGIAEKTYESLSKKITV